MVDVGTNNHLPSTAKANFPYDGIDYTNSVATGRFSNGYNVADKICYKESPPAYLGPPGRDSSKGLNFASAGSGISDETGYPAYHVVVSFEKQIEQFANITYVKGDTKNTAPTFSKALFLINFGSNDIFEHTRSKSNLSDHEFVTALGSRFLRQIKFLYDVGARRFGVIGVPPMGCCPYARAELNNFGVGFVRELDDLAKAFNHMVETLLRSLSTELEDMKYSFGDADKTIMQIINYPFRFGIKETRRACCGGGKFKGELPSNKFMNISDCPNRRPYLFWDRYHPTEYVARYIAHALYNGDGFVTPINFKQLLSA